MIHRAIGVLAIAAVMIVPNALAAQAVALPNTLSADEPTPDADAPLVSMPDVDVDSYADEAAALPRDMVDSLASDVGITPEEYLAIADAAAASTDVVAGLEANGVAVTSTRMDGTDLVVSIADPVDAALVEQVGAVAEVGDGAAWSFDAERDDVVPLADISGGEGYAWNDTSESGWVRCSTGFTGYAASTGTPTLLTAGHCLSDWTTADGVTRRVDQSLPAIVSGASLTLGATIGTPVASATLFGAGVGADAGLITADGVTSLPRVLTWGGGQSAPTSGTPVSVKGTATAVAGAVLCRSGSTTGWQCGTILSAAESVAVPTTTGSATVVSVIARVCALSGDSGGSAVMGRWAIGVTSWRTGTADTCEDGQLLGVSPLRTADTSYANVDIESKFAGVWELAVAVETPAVTSSAGTSTGAIARSTTVSGTIAEPTSDTSVRLSVDGTPSTTQTASSGSWSLAFPTSASPGIHTYEVQGRSGQWSGSSGTATGRFTNNLAVARYAGSDRYATAIAISRALIPTGQTAPVVYIASGLNYPDALSAAPAAGTQGGVLLLVGPTGVTTELRNELLRLAPQRIVVVGGEPSVSADVFTALQAISTTDEVVRIGGADRYETSRLIVEDAFGSAQTAYVATGWSYPDALSGAAVGAARGWPVLLVNGAAQSADAPTIQALRSLGVSEIKVLGSAASVSDGILTSLTTIDADPQRIGGSDRFQTSALVAADAFAGVSAPTAFVATGLSFPDALAGAVLAGATDAPLVISWSDCVTPAVLGALDGIGTTSVGVLGSTASLASSIEWLQECR